MRRSRFSLPLIAVGVVLIAGASVAAGLSGADAAKARRDHMKAQGASMKAIVAQLKSGAPDLAVIKVEAAKLDASSKDLPGWFPVGSGVEADPKSKALPAVWTDKALFADKAAALRTAAVKLNTDAQAGNAAAIGPDVQGVGGSCKGCHEKFEAKDPA